MDVYKKEINSGGGGGGGGMVKGVGLQFLCCLIACATSASTNYEALNVTWTSMTENKGHTLSIHDTSLKP